MASRTPAPDTPELRARSGGFTDVARTRGQAMLWYMRKAESVKVTFE